MQSSLFFSLYSFKKKFSPEDLFQEKRGRGKRKGGGRGREGVKYWCDRETSIRCLPYVPPAGIEPKTWLCVLTRVHNLLGYGAMLQPTEQPGWCSLPIFKSSACALVPGLYEHYFISLEAICRGCSKCFEVSGGIGSGFVLLVKHLCIYVSFSYDFSERQKQCD